MEFRIGDDRYSIGFSYGEFEERKVMVLNRATGEKEEHVLRVQLTRATISRNDPMITTPTDVMWTAVAEGVARLNPNPKKRRGDNRLVARRIALGRALQQLCPYPVDPPEPGRTQAKAARRRAWSAYFAVTRDMGASTCLGETAVEQILIRHRLDPDVGLDARRRALLRGL